MHLQAGRAHLLARTGRVAEALEAAAGEVTAAERLTDPALRATLAAAALPDRAPVTP